MLTIGARGWEVSALQQKLSQAGFDPGGVDGVFGPRTQQAVLAFQASKGITTDGKVGPETMGAMGISGFDRRRTPRPSNQDSFNTNGPAAPDAAPQARGTAMDNFLRNALAQQGKPYVFGAEANPNDPNPRAFDCSELIEWAARRAGVRVPDGAINQINAARPMSVAEALRTPGAILYRPSSGGSGHHIAISLGDGRTMEARSTASGIHVFGNAAGGRWTRGGMLPGLG